MPDLAVALTRGWVRLYTRGLPADVRMARRAELESDLWEHVQWSRTEARWPGLTAVEIVLRLVAGMAADLWWRLEHRAARRRTTRLLGGGMVIRLLKQHGMMALTVALGLFALIMVPIAVTLDEVASASERWLYGAGSFACGLLVLGGLIVMRRGLPGGRAAIALGSIGVGLITFWLVVPLAAALVIVVWLYAPRRSAQPA